VPKTSRQYQSLKQTVRSHSKLTQKGRTS